ncbi:MAG: carbohydrate ABC transporter permease [Treponema sp.]|nr:carbohydrate ABC transporter permease [Treponema sp.]
MAKEKVHYNGLIRDFDLKSTPVKTGYTIIFIFGLLVSFLGVAPLIWMILSGFKSIREFMTGINILPEEWDFASYVTTWNQLGFTRYYLNSFFSVAGSVVSAVFFNGLLGYVLSKVKPAGSKIVYGLVLWSLLIPATTSLVPLFINIVRLNLVGTFIPLWLAIGANAFFVILFKNFFDDLPQSLIEAAQIDGCKNFTIFMKIAIPLSKPIIIVIIIYAINAAWSDFLLPYLVLGGSQFETVMVRLFSFRMSRSNEVQIIRALVFSIIPPIIMFFIFQKQIAGMALHSGIKG